MLFLKPHETHFDCKYEEEINLLSNYPNLDKKKSKLFKCPKQSQGVYNLASFLRMKIKEGS